jgi:hypothetical protein
VASPPHELSVLVSPSRHQLLHQLHENAPLILAHDEEEEEEEDPAATCQMTLWGFVCDLWSKEKVLPPNMPPFFLKWEWVSLNEVKYMTYIRVIWKVKENTAPEP